MPPPAAVAASTVSTSAPFSLSPPRQLREWLFLLGYTGAVAGITSAIYYWRTTKQAAATAAAAVATRTQRDIVKTTVGPQWLTANGHLPASASAASASSASSASPPPRHVSERQFGDSSDPLDPEWFRLHAHSLVDWIAEYRSALNDERWCTRAADGSIAMPVQCQLQPGWLAKALPASAPEQAEPWSAVLQDVQRLLVPGLTHWQSPHFYAWFKNHASFPSFLGDLLSDAFSSVGFSWLSSPASAELEAVVMDWCAQLFRLPHHFLTSSGIGGGSICQTAGEAAIIALLTAKRKAMDGYEDGARSEDERQHRQRSLVLYVSDQAHGILGRATKVAGIPSSRVRLVKTRQDNGWRMDAQDVRAAMAADVAAGLLPFFLWITTGTTSTAAVDDIASLAAVGHEYGAWVHADGAYGGVYALLPELAALFDFSPLDSLNVNAHKGLFTHFDLALLFVCDRHWLVNALTLPGMAILRNAHSDAGTVIDYKDWGLSFGRRFRSLKLWCVMRCFGIARLQQMLRWSIDGLREVGQWMREDGRWDVLEDSPRLGLLCFRVTQGLLAGRDADALSKELMERCNRGGEIFFSQTVVGGRTVLRLATTGVETRQQLRRDWLIIRKNLDELIRDEGKKRDEDDK